MSIDKNKLSEQVDKEKAKEDNLEQHDKEKTQLENEKKEEEETLVLLQFTDLDDAQYCQQFSNKFKTINLDKKSPIIQIGSRFYSGEYTNNIGTYLFFEENKSNLVLPSTSSAVEDNIVHSNQEFSNKLSSDEQLNSYNYFGKTFKKLVLNRLFIEEKE